MGTAHITAARRTLAEAVGRDMPEDRLLAAAERPSPNWPLPEGWWSWSRNSPRERATRRPTRATRTDTSSASANCC